MATTRKAISTTAHRADPDRRRSGRAVCGSTTPPSGSSGARAGDDWRPIGPKLNAAVISDEGRRGEHGSFCGAFVGMVTFDTSGRGAEAGSPASATTRPERRARVGTGPGTAGCCASRAKCS
ncbi:MAG: hypothetical protein R3D59_09120 [Paracoccaceae bacterium]